MTEALAWKLWSRRRDGRAREWLFERYRGLATLTVVRCAAPGGMTRDERDTFVPWVEAALWQSLETFDPARARWETYAIGQMRWAFVNARKDHSWGGRRVCEEREAIGNAASRLRAALGREPDEAEVRAALGWGRRRYDGAALNRPPAALPDPEALGRLSGDAAPDGGSGESEWAGDPCPIVLRRLARARLWDAVDLLDARSAEVLRLHDEGLSFAAIGGRLGLDRTYPHLIYKKAVRSLARSLRD
jgi:DNA-directed RNA polymerase specialized sigma subunit